MKKVFMLVRSPATPKIPERTHVVAWNKDHQRWMAHCGTRRFTHDEQEDLAPAADCCPHCVGLIEAIFGLAS